MTTKIKPGTVIVWTHYTTTGPVERIGTVWSLAPTLGGGHKGSYWVIPDEPLPGDLYNAICVGGRGKTNSYLTGAPFTLPPGELFSTDDTNKATGSTTWAAGLGATRVQEAAA